VASGEQEEEEEGGVVGAGEGRLLEVREAEKTRGGGAGMQGSGREARVEPLTRAESAGGRARVAWWPAMRLKRRRERGRKMPASAEGAQEGCGEGWCPGDGGVG
jgi:hypothetical protein